MTMRPAQIRRICRDDMKRRIKFRSGVSALLFADLHHRAYLEYPEAHVRTPVVQWWR